MRTLISREIMYQKKYICNQNLCVVFIYNIYVCMVIGNTIGSRWKPKIKDFKFYINIACINISVDINT